MKLQGKDDKLIKGRGKLAYLLDQIYKNKQRRKIGQFCQWSLGFKVLNRPHKFNSCSQIEYQERLILALSQKLRVHNT